MQKNVTPGRRKGRPNYPPEFKQQLVVASCEPGVLISKLRWKTASYGRQGVELSSLLLSGWVDACSRLLEPLDESLQRYVLNDGKLHADDTLVLVLLSGNKKTKTGRLWTYVRDDRNAGSELAPAVWFAYSPERNPQTHLAGFSGVLQADAHAGLNGLYLN